MLANIGDNGQHDNPAFLKQGTQLAVSSKSFIFKVKKKAEFINPIYIVAHLTKGKILSR